MTAVFLKFTLRDWATKPVFISLAPYTPKQLRQPLLLPTEYLVYFLIVENSIFYLPTDYVWRIFRLLVIKQQPVNYCAFERNAHWGSEITRQNFLQSKCHKVLTSQYERFSVCQTNSKSVSYWSMCSWVCLTWNVKPESIAK